MATKEQFLRLQALVQAGRFEEADIALRETLRFEPRNPNWLHLAAIVAEGLGDPARAEALLRQALDALPGWMEARYNLARVLGTSGKLREAVALMQSVAQTHPHLPQAWEGLAKFTQRLGDSPGALAHWRRVRDLAPENEEARAQSLILARSIADWREPIAFPENLPPQAAVLFTDDPALQKQATERYARAKFGAIQPLPPPEPRRPGRWRVGYLSSDFRTHATAHLIAELFELHDRERFEVTAWCTGDDDGSAARTRIARGAERFVALGALPARPAAERMRADGVDILIDLKGYTRGGRLDILAHRPAPVQLHWLGWPGTLGAAFVDGFIADSVTVPPGAEVHFTEKVLRLPDCYQINDRKRPLGVPPSRAACGLPDDAVVLVCLNQTFKITPEVFDLWCALLRDHPEAVVWLYESNIYAPEALRQAAAGRGVDPTRLVFAPHRPLEAHIARLALADLALDTFPVGGHTTTSDALWAGVPVVTRAGHSFVSRVAASLLTAVDLQAFITKDAESYRARVDSLIRDPAAREAARRHLQENRATLPLFDTPRFVRAFEALLLEAVGG